MSTNEIDVSYYPSKPPFWTRTKVGAVGVAVGLMLGSGIGGEDPLPKRAESSDNAVGRATPGADADSGHEAEIAGLESKLEAAQGALEDQRANAKNRIAAIKKKMSKAHKKAVVSAVARTRSAERARAQDAIQAARREAAATSSSVSPTTGTDPRFSYCYEANDAGYGPYQRGVDPEYDWYDDSDGDGLVCET